MKGGMGSRGPGRPIIFLFFVANLSFFFFCRNDVANTVWAPQQEIPNPSEPWNLIVTRSSISLWRILLILYLYEYGRIYSSVALVDNPHFLAPPEKSSYLAESSWWAYALFWAVAGLITAVRRQGFTANGYQYSVGAVCQLLNSHIGRSRLRGPPPKGGTSVSRIQQSFLTWWRPNNSGSRYLRETTNYLSDF